KENNWLLFYPVVINLTMLGLFGYSLKHGPSMIERLARLKEPDLPDEAIGYLNSVTLIWCGLFIFNGSMALYTALYTSIETWTLYNGLIAYLLIGSLLGGEWLYRTFWLKKS
ncbi:Clp protease, partial [Psychrobacter sp. 1Y1]